MAGIKLEWEDSDTAPVGTDTTVDATEEKKTYLLETKNGGQRRLTVPSSWKVTFGPTVPFERKGAGGYRGDEGTWALRLYEKGDKLRAIFTDVKSFRDMDIQVQEKRITTKRQTVEKADRHGGKNVVAEARIEEWVDPDSPESDDSKTPEEYLRLEHRENDL